jgi:hypothetical protein
MVAEKKLLKPNQFLLPHLLKIYVRIAVQNSVQERNSVMVAEQARKNLQQ